MKFGKIVIAIMAIVSLTACIKPSDVLPLLSPSAMTSGGSKLSGNTNFMATSSKFSVTEVVVDVPSSLTVSEANSFKPNADIVWREDPIGDRRSQVKTILQAAFDRGVSTLQDGHPVILNIKLLEFHALTHRTRYTVGGTHAISFELTVLDASTLAVVEPTRTIVADFRAYGGREAIAAEARGETQKVRITEHLANVILYEMSRPRDFLPEGFVAENLAQYPADPSQ
ncbi:hypothetical protein O2N63_16605 [Aliiroseovarius sp. KMU-50]|uniref:Lipoprotein n=1 Tax=Aliiroseovarius salicola TaxID=3009082 RepID=A0ABT4W5C4_9RHOB|nr:DUF6778 family protein [Aliiroseovarius sp. KMU-50]MDA5095714.1 hypothetical protein [Aliiroseovarius sp. KMU-50]